MDLYQSYIHRSRYARYLPEKKRRENWEETVKRYFDFMENHLKENHNYDLGEVRTTLERYVVEQKIMPSMRAMMTAGPALERDSTAGYNCSYVAIDDPKAFDEAMHILLCGTGVGFSVERQYINQLPEIPDKIFNSDMTIIVKDSKEGWAKGLRQLIALLYTGERPNWDLSKLRPAGSPLKTFGGRSSGPEPLDDLFHFVVKIFYGAKGRKLNSLECHDIMCKIGETVVVGGVRRSAMISLSNLSDDRMRNAKTGAWWEANVQRALSNNSAVYTERPEVGMFMQEWLSLYESKSGERGMFNREASINQVKKSARRKHDYEFGTNPCCVSGDTVLDILLNGKPQKITISDLTEYCKQHPRTNIKVKGWNFTTNVAEYNEMSFIGLTRPDAKLLKITDTETGKSIKVTPDHQVWTENRGWIEAKDLVSSDELKII